MQAGNNHNDASSNADFILVSTFNFRGKISVHPNWCRCTFESQGLIPPCWVAVLRRRNNDQYLEFKMEKLFSS